MQQGGIDHNELRHEAIQRRLKFQKQMDVQPILAPAYSPNGVTVPATQILRDVAAVFQIQRSYPLFRQEADQ